MAQRLGHLPAMQETWVQSLGWEDPLEKEMATHSSILAWRIPWREEPGGLQAMGLQTSDTIERLHFHFHSISGFSKENNGIISINSMEKVKYLCADCKIWSGLAVYIVTLNEKEPPFVL